LRVGVGTGVDVSVGVLGRVGMTVDVGGTLVGVGGTGVAVGIGVAVLDGIGVRGTLVEVGSSV
jgi:hypothetical protein